jgi:hypothetical protein
MPNLWFQDHDREAESGEAWASRVATEALGPVYGIFEGAARGAWTAIYDGNPWRGLEAASPKAIRDLMRSGRYAAEGVTTRNGDPINEDTSWADVVRQAIGFTPAAVAERFDANSRMMNRQNRIVDQRSGIMRRVGDRIMAGEAIPADLLDEMRAFNREYPMYPITSDSIRQSVRSRQNASQRNEFGIALNPRLNDLLRGEEAPLVYGA